MISYARVVAISKSVVPEAETAGEFIAFAARISNPANQANRSTGAKLLDYLRRNKHWSPFEMAWAAVEVETPRDIARQLLRHRSFQFQEFSQRYAEATEFTTREARRQDNTNRQSSIDDLPAETRDWWAAEQADLLWRADAIYREALRRGMAKECARAVLPEGLTLSRLYVAGNFRSWLHYLEVREDPSTQMEHRQLAQAIRAALAEYEPMFALQPDQETRP